VSIVNGYLCLNCADEALAKRQIDPRKGAASAQAEKASPAPALGLNAPQPGAVTGGKLNLYA
jgi:hypothetical protein